MEELVIRETLSEAIQLPAIIKAGSIQIHSPELSRLNKTDLKALADTMGGELVYLKYYAVYTLATSEAFPEVPMLCVEENCYRPVDRSSGTFRCSDHSKRR